MAVSILYISYDGLMEPLGQSQVLQYLKGLADEHFEITLITFEKKADAGAWSRDGSLYRIVKRLERTFLTHADVVVSLTHAAVATMRRFPYMSSLEVPPRFQVIPTCANLEMFNDTKREVRQASHPLTLGYLGSAARCYDFPAVLQAFL